MPMPSPSAAITGFVTTVGGNLITLLNGAVTIDATGAVFPSRKGNGTIADVRPGQQIIAAIRNPEAAPGTMLLAASVLIVEMPAGSLSGPVQSVDVAGSALTILGAQVRVTANTRILSFSRDGAATLEDIKAGDHVSIEVSIDGSALIAESIRVLPPIPNAAVDGTVKSIGTTSWVITTLQGDVTVTVTPDTRIDPTVKAGDPVHVIGMADAAGSITAIAIYAARPRPAEPPGQPGLEGTVQSIGATSWVITTGGGDITITVDRNTKIDPAVKVGDTVIVIVRRDAAGNLLAVSIHKAESKRRSTRA